MIESDSVETPQGGLQASSEALGYRRQRRALATYTTVAKPYSSLWGPRGHDRIKKYKSSGMDGI